MLGLRAANSQELIREVPVTGSPPMRELSSARCVEHLRVNQPHGPRSPQSGLSVGINTHTHTHEHKHVHTHLKPHGQGPRGSGDTGQLVRGTPPSPVTTGKCNLIEAEEESSPEGVVLIRKKPGDQATRAQRVIVERCVVGIPRL